VEPGTGDNAPFWDGVVTARMLLALFLAVRASGPEALVVGGEG